MDVSEEDKQKLDASIRKQLWMVRDCYWYDAEYSDCTSIRGRFHQYFVYGEPLDCTQWKRDSKNCYKWESSRDPDSVKELINSELERREKRLDAFYDNGVWEHRTEPPSNWNDPLPEWMEKKNENSFLAMKAEQEKVNPDDRTANRQSLCRIM
ncbi:synaptic plasticity regulator PANTS [Lycorma delicatula]|uniref:synaptic plasticity regulator PANTS n=1 Tax=Lycorma delicatula TaxID=130591 RepID=UPI003F513EC5